MEIGRRQRVLITIACMLGTSLAALDSTIVGTAMPTIVGEMGGLALYPWVFSGYLLASTTTVPIYGRLADLYGRKPLFLFGSALFLLGSALCGAAHTMTQLIVFRALQGLGAGAVLPITMTIIGDVYTMEQRARIQGLFSGVWGVSSVVGPAIGGFLVQYLSWRWVFYVNVPFGLLAWIFMTVALTERVVRRQHEIDYVGAITLSVGVTSLLLALLQGGTSLPFGSPALWALYLFALVCLAAFFWQERRAKEPMLPLSLFENRVISVSSLAGCLSGMVMFGLSSYVPLFVQGVQGGAPTTAGAALAPMSLGWPIGSIVGGRLILRLGYRPSTLTGLAFIVTGSALVTVALQPATPLPLLGAVMALVGVGLGFSSLAFLLAVQNSVTWGRRGVATASVQFFRTIGGSVGVAVMGAILANGMRPYLSSLGPGPGGSSQRGGASLLLDPAARATLSADALHQLAGALNTSLHLVYVLIAGLAIAGLIVAFQFPSGKVAQQGTVGRPSAEPARDLTADPTG